MPNKRIYVIDKQKTITLDSFYYSLSHLQEEVNDLVDRYGPGARIEFLDLNPEDDNLQCEITKFRLETKEEYHKRIGK